MYVIMNICSAYSNDFHFQFSQTGKNELGLHRTISMRVRSVINWYLL